MGLHNSELYCSSKHGEGSKPARQIGDWKGIPRYACVGKDYQVKGPCCVLDEQKIQRERKAKQERAGKCLKTSTRSCDGGIVDPDSISHTPPSSTRTNNWWKNIPIAQTFHRESPESSSLSIVAPMGDCIFCYDENGNPVGSEETKRLYNRQQTNQQMSGIVKTTGEFIEKGGWVIVLGVVILWFANKQYKFI